MKRIDPKAEKPHTHSSKVRVRFYIPTALASTEIVLSRDQIRHLKVLRLMDGEKIGIFDGKGAEFEVTCSEKVRNGTITLNTPHKARQELPVKITLAIAVPKGDRIDVLVEKVSELGIIKLVPIVFSRSVVVPREAKIDRLRKIAIEAVCQSERSIVPIISEPLLFASLLETFSEYNQVLLCHADGEPLDSAITLSGSILVIVGPEGDFTPAELASAAETGCKKVRLGPSILRTETAGIAAVAQIAGLCQAKRNTNI